TLLGEGGISLLVVAGVAGAAAAHLRAGDVVLPAKVAELSGGKTHIAALHLAGRGFAARPPVHAGGIAYTAHRVCGAGDKAVLRERDPGAAIVDMESFHACEAAARRGVPCLVVRGVSDTADFCFPKIVVADRKSLRDVFGNFPWNPAELVRLVRLWRDCDAAAANMAAVLACVLKDIVI
ncbi:MAG TPA: hypothetical protein P5287_04470, partial [bacterium]|nr:hypothetical protein [bacterium]